jgi:hypothetical protein
MDGLQAAETYKTHFFEKQLPESLPIEIDSHEFPEILRFRSLKNRYNEAVIIEVPAEERVKAFIPERPLIGDVGLVWYLESNNKKLKDAMMGVRQCPWCKPEENLHVVCYKGDNKGNKSEVKFLAKIGGRNGDSHKGHGFLFKTKHYETIDHYICSEDFGARRRERYNITTA